MKKFLMSLLVAVAILLPTIAVEAADVPSFYQIGSQDLTLTEKNVSEQGFRYYVYDCDVNLDEDFAETFVRNLISDYNFRQTAHFVNDYTEDQETLFETWCLVYTGSKKFSKFTTTNYENMQKYKANLSVCRHKNWQTGITRFWIYVSNGLTYGDD